MRDAQAASLRALAGPVRGMRVLYWGGSGAGFPGGDGPREAAEVLPEVGVDLTYTFAGDPAEADKLSRRYDLAIITNTRVAALKGAGDRIWNAAERSVWYFWDLRPAKVGGALAGNPSRVFLTYSGPWTSPNGEVYDPKEWASVLGCPVGYCPQGAPLRSPVKVPGGPRVLFVGDLGNPTYHRGRRELCQALDARVMNAKPREDRLAIERRMPELYRSARYVLSTSPLAPGYTSVRTYSILACGGLMLLHRFPDSERLYRDGEHVVMFDTADELKEKLAALDGDEARRESIAAAGRKLHAEHHTVAHRVLDICRQMTGAPPASWLS